MTGHDMRLRRVQLGLTQAQFGAALGRCLQSVSQWERGVTPIPGYVELALEALERRCELARSALLTVA